MSPNLDDVITAHQGLLEPEEHRVVIVLHAVESIAIPFRSFRNVIADFSPRWNMKDSFFETAEDAPEAVEWLLENTSKKSLYHGDRS